MIGRHYDFIGVGKMNNSIIDYGALGKKIQERRRQLGLSQQHAAERLNLSTSFFSRVERGEKVASLETLIKIANTLELSLDYLLKESLKNTVSNELTVLLAQIFTDKTAEETDRLLRWLNVLSKNIDKL